MTPHEILGISPDASQREIQRAFRVLAVKFHPDKSGNDPKKFLQIKEAYEALKRSAWEDNRIAKPTSIIGLDLKISIRATLSDMAWNKSKTLNYIRKISCSHCERMPCKACGGTGWNPVSMVMGPKRKCKKCLGTGHVKTTKWCQKCGGIGYIEKKSSVNLKLNPLMSGPIIFRGEGNDIEGSGKGDLIIEVILEKDPIYSFSSLNLKRNLHITPAQAAVGDTVQVDILGEMTELVIPSGTQNGQIIRKSGAGLSHENRSGDLCVTVVVDVPKIISNEEKALYKGILEIEKKSGLILF